ncbi:hypothetical protein Patl1_30870 [Pistacia atlantica]|uniref:Uncharacterized protein n=1 Tax=Pistacia atlantica TaxID=434234 RepID=A0ACC1A848_9ROSI|nr:hypothetical protein Patl1_30870 [Pistacia atlantica]
MGNKAGVLRPSCFDSSAAYYFCSRCSTHITLREDMMVISPSFTLSDIQKLRLNMYGTSLYNLHIVEPLA